MKSIGGEWEFWGEGQMIGPVTLVDLIETLSDYDEDLTVLLPYADELHPGSHVMLGNRELEEAEFRNYREFVSICEVDQILRGKNLRAGLADTDFVGKALLLIEYIENDA